VERHSLYRSAHEEAREHMRRLVGDLGASAADGALSEWNRDHWWRWAAERVLQHVRGDAFWAELGHRTFATVTQENHDGLEVLARIEALTPDLEDDELLDFKARQRAMSEWADLINRLLDGREAP